MIIRRIIIATHISVQPHQDLRFAANLEGEVPWLAIGVNRDNAKPLNGLISIIGAIISIFTVVDCV